MRNFSRIGFFLLTGFLSARVVQAHTVDWLENPFGSTPANAMVFYYPRDSSGKVRVDPSYNEPCTVVVNVNPSTSTLVNVQVLPPNLENSVSIAVQVLRAPSNHLETATITGEWHATGLPTGFGCDAVSPNPFSVPISVSDQMPAFQIQSAGAWINLSGPYAALQSSRSLSGPWTTIGIGQTFSVMKTMDTGFFLQTKKLGGFIGGIVLDNAGSPLSNLSVGLQYGGPTVFTDFYGSYSVSRSPAGDNSLTFSNSNGASLNVTLSNTNDTPTNSYTANMLKLAMVAAPLADPTNICNCTPWCAIGFGTQPGGLTPVYYSGGANAPNGGSPSCGQPVVTVTPPVGAPFTITPGSNRQQNSGPNPASGTWTITAVVCGITKTATITVP